MKFSHLFVFALALGTFACGNKEKANETAVTVPAAGSLTDGSYTLDTASMVTWEGSKAAYAHNGTIAVSSGSFTVANGAINGGSFAIDMNSIVDSDVTDAEKRGQLEGHLKSADFFDAPMFPSATFVIKEVTPLNGVVGSSHTIKGDFTLKGVTKEIMFNANVANDASSVTTTAAFEIDRSLWNVKFNSSAFPEFANLAADKIISNTIKLSFSLKAIKG